MGVLVWALLSPTAVPRLRATRWGWFQFSPGWFVLGGGRPQVQPGSPSDGAALRSRAVCGTTIAAALRESRHIVDCVAKRGTCRVSASANAALRNRARQVRLAVITGARSGGMSGPSEATRYLGARVAREAPSEAVLWDGSAFAPGGPGVRLPFVAGRWARTLSWPTRMGVVDGGVWPRVPNRWTGGLRSLNCAGFRLRGAWAAPLRPNSPPCHGPCRAGPAPRSSSSETPDTLGAMLPFKGPTTSGECS